MLPVPRCPGLPNLKGGGESTTRITHGIMTKTVTPMQQIKRLRCTQGVLHCSHVAEIKVDAARVESTGVISMLPREDDAIATHR